MKFIGLAAISLFHSASSSFLTNEENLWNRTFGTMQQILLADYKNYGCWCFLAQEPQGRGTPVNEIDRVCRSLAWGYECINMDEGCSAHETHYNAPDIDFTTAGLLDDEIRNACLTANGNVNGCEVKVCLVENAFLRDWWPYYAQNGMKVEKK